MGDQPVAQAQLRGHKEFALPLMWLANRRSGACLRLSAGRGGPFVQLFKNFYLKRASLIPLHPKEEADHFFGTTTHQRFNGQLAESPPPCLIPGLPPATIPSGVWVVIVGL